MMLFFSGARTLWTANEKRSAIYADATVAMDLMSQLLQSTFYNNDSGTPFAITGAPAATDSTTPREIQDKAITVNTIDGWNSKILFVSNSPLELSKGGSVRYLSFQRKSDTTVSGVYHNVLEILVFSDSSKIGVDDSNDEVLSFDQCFSPFGLDKTAEEVKDYLRDKVFKDDTQLTANERKVVLRNVTGLKFTPVDYKGQMVYGTECNTLPAGIEIELSLMENEQTIRDYQALDTKALRDEFRLKNEYTFRRTVWLGDRTVSL